MASRSAAARASVFAAALALALAGCGGFGRSGEKRADSAKLFRFGEGLESGSPKAKGSPQAPAGRRTITKHVLITPFAAPQGGGARFRYDDDGPVGAMAIAYLRDELAGTLVLEIDYVAGKAPASTAISHLHSVLSRETHKPGGIEIDVDDEIPASRSSWSGADIEDLERRYRDRHSADGTATIWMVYLNGTFADASGALGVAFRASRIALFKDRIADAAIPTIPAARVERSVIVHEVGHVLALVNLGWESPRNHEDPEHPGHSRNRGSVMFWAVETVSVNSILSGGPPEDFDSDDRADLRRLREGT